MDRRQMLVQHAREFFGERIEDVLHNIRQDRQDLRGWQEPAHVRAVVRRTVREDREGDDSSAPGRVAVSELEVCRTAGEPERGQQREAVGQLLEAGTVALEKVIRNTAMELTPEETAGLECVLLLYGRPALLLDDDGQLAGVPPFWNVLEDQRDEIETIQRGVGRIELLGHPEYDWAGTGFLVTDEILLTSRRVGELFTEKRDEHWQFRPGISVWMNYRSAFQQVAEAGYRVRNVVGMHDQYDLALLEVERPQSNGRTPVPLALAAVEPPYLENRPIYLLGYPVRDARRNEPEAMARVFRDVYNVKRVMPGQLRGVLTFGEVRLLRHDAAPLGLTAGSPLLDLESHEVIGMQTTSRYLDGATAVPLYLLRDDPLIRRAGITFAVATREERESTTAQLERLSRTRFWRETQASIQELYRKAFGER
jgi:hypothetical protein